MSARPAFQQLQYEFTAHIRAPEHNPMPSGIEDRRMGIYRDLLFNNVKGLLSGTFPVLYEILPEARWESLMRDYFHRHQSHTPLFPQMPREFLRYLEEEYETLEGDPPFLWELAHYEWAELALSINTRELDLSDIDPAGDLLAGEPNINPLAWVLAYRFPVQHISPDYQPAEAPEQPTYLVVYRDHEDEMGFTELNPVSARLLEYLNMDASLSGQNILQKIAEELQHPNPDIVIQGGLDIMRQMLAKDIILGVKKT